MTADEQAALGRIEEQIRALRGEMMARFDRHEARHQALDDASRARQVAIEHRVTAAEEKAVAAAQRAEIVDKRVCVVEKTLRQRTLLGGVLVGIGAAGAWLAQFLGLGKPGP